jgi:hypothetical protein
METCQQIIWCSDLLWGAIPLSWWSTKLESAMDDQMPRFSDSTFGNRTDKRETRVSPSSYDKLMQWTNPAQTTPSRDVLAISLIDWKWEYSLSDSQWTFSINQCIKNLLSNNDIRPSDGETADPPHHRRKYRLSSQVLAERGKWSLSCTVALTRMFQLGPIGRFGGKPPNLTSSIGSEFW